MSYKILAVVAATLALIIAVTNIPEKGLSRYEQWKEEHGIRYSKSEDAYRERVFMNNLANIEKHNSRPDKTYTQGVNQFSALTHEQFAQIYLTLKPGQYKQLAGEDLVDNFVGDIDWTIAGAVTPIKDQGQCGSCWAFSTTGALEALNKIETNKLLSFSEQQLVDCSGAYGNKACDGGMMNNAFKYVRDRGISLETEYPYKAVKQVCQKDAGDFRCGGFVDALGCTALSTALVIRPISIAVDATNWSPYKNGVFSDCDTKLNHGVLLVGVSQDYWRVKNSWSAKWGENGFIRLARGNTCGICTIPSYPTAAK